MKVNVYRTTQLMAWTGFAIAAASMGLATIIDGKPLILMGDASINALSPLMIGAALLLAGLIGMAERGSIELPADTPKCDLALIMALLNNPTRLDLMRAVSLLADRATLHNQLEQCRGDTAVLEAIAEHKMTVYAGTNPDVMMVTCNAGATQQPVTSTRTDALRIGVLDCLHRLKLAEERKKPQPQTGNVVALAVN